MKRALAVVLALALAVSPVAPLALAAPSAAAPPGMSTIPSDNARFSDTTIERGKPKVSALPAQAQGGPPPQALKHIPQQALDQIQASSHASTLVVDIAPTDSGGVGLVLTDEQNSDGRRVAVPTSVFDGDVPDLARGVHESGEQWQAPISVDGDYATFRVPHFSSNTVTFSGTLEIKAQPANDAAQFTYDIADLDSASDPELTLTGSQASEWDNESATGLRNGDSTTVSLAGDTIQGPSSDREPMLVYTGRTLSGNRLIDSDSEFSNNQGSASNVGVSSGLRLQDAKYNPLNSESDGSTGPGLPLWGDSDTDIGIRSSWEFTPDKDMTISKLQLDSQVYSGSDYNFRVDIYISQGESDTSFQEGTLVKDMHNPPYGGSQTIQFDNSYSVTAGTTYEIEFITSGSDNDGSIDRITLGSSSTNINENKYNNNVGDSFQYVGDLNFVDSKNNGAWDSTWYNWGSTTGHDNITISVSTLGDGSLYAKFQTSDDASTVKDSSTWVSLSSGTNTIDLSGISGGQYSRLKFDFSKSSNTPVVDSYEYDELPTMDPKVDIDGDGVYESSVSGSLSDGETVTKELAGVSTSTSSLSIGTASSSKVDIKLQVQEISNTTDPSVEVNGEWLNHSGQLSDGDSVNLTGNQSWLTDTQPNRINLSVGDGTLSADAPNPQVDLNYSHDAEDNQAIDYSDQQWTSGYNQSKTWASDRASAELSIPFENNVVAVRDLQHRINGSSWSATSSANYDLSGNDLTVDLDAIYGGTIPATTSMAVKVTGGKVKTSDLDLTVLNATAAGADLDSKIQVSNLGTDPTINVGPTDEGKRVHHLYSESWSNASESVVIESNGDQHLEMPNAVEDGTARVTHLDTRVVANTGDVRIEVLEAGETPELDVSPGPGGEGDDVTIEYYNTQTGVEYLLESLTNSIVLDSDTAESPAIFSDDDSDETWSIFEDDSNTSSSSTDSSGGIGQVAREAGDSVLDKLPLLLGIGGGLLVAGIVASRLFGDSDSVGEATGSVARSTGSLTARLGGTFQGILGGVLSWTGGVLASILANRRAAIALGVVGLIGANALGLIGLPSGTGTLLVVAGVPLASFIVLTSIGRYSQTIWIGTTTVATVLGLELIAPGTVSTAITQLTSETVAPLLILLVGGVAFYWFRIRGEEASTPDEVNEITIEGGDD